VNPNGLDHPEHYSTARDLSILTAYAMENPVFARTVATKTVTIGHRVLRNHNKLLWQVEGADGVKTGYTKAAGRILVSSAVRDGRRLIAVTINDGNDWKDHASMLNDGFSRYSVQTLIDAGQELGELAVIGGQETRVRVVAAEPYVLSVAPGESVTCQLSGQPFVYASVVRGAKGPDAYVLIDGKVVGKVSTVYADTVEQETTPKKPSFWEKIFGGKQ
jgi:D-alanyl-D-alanine carboxypeptidase